MLHHGLYEQVINNQLNSELSEIPEACKAVAPIDKAEASKVLAQYLADVVQKGLENVVDNGGDISAQIALTNQIVDLIQNDNNRTIKQADNSIFLLKKSNIPSIIIECGFLSNYEELTLLKNPDYQDKIAFAIYCGLLEYYS